MMNQLNSVLRWIFPIVLIFIVPIWIHYFSFSMPSDRHVLIFEGSYLLLFIVGYFLVLKLENILFEVLWFFFVCILVLKLLDEFSPGITLFDKDFKAGVQICGILIALLGFYLFQRKWKKEAARSRLVEKRIHENENRYSLLAENSSDLIELLDSEGNVTYASPSHLQVLGYTPLELVNNSIFKMIHPDYENILLKALSEHVNTGAKKQIEIRFKERMGQWLSFETILSTPKDYGKTANQVLLSARDITRSKLSEESLEETRNQYKNLFQKVSVGIYSMNPEGKIVIANTALVHMLGYSSFDEVTLINLERKSFDENYSWSQFKELFKANNEVRGYESKWKKRDGTPIFVRENITAIRKEDNSILYYEGTVEDITEQKHLSETLGTTEQRYDALIENTYDLVIETTVNGNFLNTNPRFREVLGYESGELIGRSIFENVHVDDYSALSAELQRSALTRYLGHVKFRYKHKNGQWIWLESACKMFPQASGEIQGFLFCRDISEHKKAVKKNNYEALSKSIGKVVYKSQNLNQVLEGAVDTINRNVSGVNAVSVYLTSGKEAVIKAHKGLPDWFLERAGRIRYPKGFIWKTIADGEPKYCPDTEKDTLISSEGKDLGTKSYGCVPIKFQGKSVGVINISSFKKNAFDEEDLKLLEMTAGQIEIAINAETLKESEARYHTLAENSYDLICEINTNGDYLYVSPNYKDILGYEPSELIGENILDLVHIDDFATLIEELKNGFKANSGRAVFRYKHRNGHWRWFECTGRTFLTASNEIRFVVVSKDTTERKRMEKELLKVQKLESLGILAGGIAHDFNNLLTAIWGNISLAKIGANFNDKIYKRLTEAEKGCLRAKDLTGQLLTFSKGGAPVKKTTSLAELLIESASFAIRGSQVKCEFDIQSDLWLSDIDEGQISQVINNLVINADQAMPEGGVIKITAENVNVNDWDQLPLKQGSYIKITVQDEGIGIAEEYLPKIFDPYFTTKQKGSGLGLATVHSILKNHDGCVRVESKLKVGTKFYVYLPASGRKTALEKETEKQPVSGRGKILIMDDEDIVRETVTEILKDLGYEVEGAVEGQQAIEMYKKAKKSDKPFDLVIMDLTVPGGMGGREAMRGLLDLDPGVKAIVSSGYSSDPVMSDHKGFGFKGMVGKPYKLEELSKTVYEVINDKPS